MNMEVTLALDDQVKALREKAAEECKRRRDGENAQLERWKDEDALAQEEDMRIMEESRRSGDQMLRSNISRDGARERDRAVEREHDVLLLQYAMDRERQEIETEKAKKEQGRGKAKEYIGFLAGNMIRDREESDYVNAIQCKEMEKIWVKRDGELQAQAEARKRLMREVNESRRLQMQEQLAEIEKEQAELAEHFMQNMEDWRSQEEAERKGADLSKSRTVENMQGNRSMMECRAERSAMERQGKHLLNKQIQYAERLHQNKLCQQGGNVQTYHPLKHTKWYS